MKKENVSPKIDDNNTTKGFGNDNLPVNVAADKAAALDNSPPPAILEETTAPIRRELDSNPPLTERPETARNERPSVVEEVKDPFKAIDIIRPATAIFKDENMGKHKEAPRDTTKSLSEKSAKEAKIDDLSIFQKIVNEQKVKEE